MRTLRSSLFIIVISYHLSLWGGGPSDPLTTGWIDHSVRARVSGALQGSDILV